MSRPALIAAGLYLAIALGTLIWDLQQPTPGGWITLRGMTAVLVTFPVSAPLDIFGLLPDLQSRINVALLVAACTALIYPVVAAIARLFTSP